MEQHSRLMEIAGAGVKDYGTYVDPDGTQASWKQGHDDFHDYTRAVAPELISMGALEREDSYGVELDYFEMAEWMREHHGQIPRVRDHIGRFNWESRLAELIAERWAIRIIIKEDTNV